MPKIGESVFFIFLADPSIYLEYWCKKIDVIEP